MYIYDNSLGEKKMTSVFIIVDYMKHHPSGFFDYDIREMWRTKMEETIRRNPDCRLSLETYMMKEISYGGTLCNVRGTYSKDLNKFFVLMDEFQNLKGFGGISKYSPNVYEINKLCISYINIADDFLIKTIIRYFNETIKRENTGSNLQIVVEMKNHILLQLMKNNGFVEYLISKNGVNVYLSYKNDTKNNC